MSQYLHVSCKYTTSTYRAKQIEMLVNDFKLLLEWLRILGYQVAEL